LPTQQQVQANRGRDSYDDFWDELELDIHNPPHRWVEGVMGTFASPGDPVFYLHHCWIDMLWARWQLAHPGASFFASSGAGAGLHDPLMEWPDRTPADVLDHHALGYVYEVELGWLATDLSGFGGGRPAAGNPVPYVTDFPGQGPTARLPYRADNGHIYQLSFTRTI
jgi:hypothetical protein